MQALMGSTIATTGSGASLLVLVIIALLAIGGAVYFNTKRRPKNSQEPDADRVEVITSDLYVEPWKNTTVGSLASMERELANEIAENPQHPLFGVPVKPLARRYDRDDFLYAVQDGTDRVVVVHLTYRPVSETDPRYPETTFFENFDSWLVEGMQKDVDEWDNLSRKYDT